MKSGNRKYELCFGQKQNGAVLALGLIILVLLTMIGMTSMRSMVDQQRMAGNIRDSEVALQAAEAGLRGGESDILNYVTNNAIFTFLDNDAGFGIVPDDVFGAPWGGGGDNFSIATGNPLGTTADLSESGAKTAAAPRYFAQEIQQLPLSSLSLAVALKMERQVFRVVARGVGGRADTQQIVQSSVIRLM